MNEKIICSAVWYKELEYKNNISNQMYLPKNITKGIVFCGYRHSQCIYTKCVVTGLKDSESGQNEQGFITSENRFVSRKEGLKIALSEQQILVNAKIEGDELFSEYLY